MLFHLCNQSSKFGSVSGKIDQNLPFLFQTQLIFLL